MYPLDKTAAINFYYVQIVTLYFAQEYGQIVVNYISAERDKLPHKTQKGLIMNYMTPKEASLLWGVSERMVRIYCVEGRIESAKLEAGSWFIPQGEPKPKRKPRATEPKKDILPLVKKIIYQHSKNIHYGIYEYIQINLAYSSNRIASNRLTRNEVTEVYRTNKITSTFEPAKIDDIIETINHFSAVKYMVDNISAPITQSFIKELHRVISYGTYADRKKKIQSGEYRKTASSVGISCRNINHALSELIVDYETQPVDLERILGFHARFEKIHPFEDYNGRIGRIIIMKECLRHGIEPFIIDDKHRSKYNHGIREWAKNPSTLIMVAKRAQERFRNQREICDMLEYCRPMTGRGAREAKTF